MPCCGGARFGKQGNRIYVCKKRLLGLMPQTPKTQKAPGQSLELFSAAPPRGCLSFAAILMGRSWFFFPEEHLDVVAVDEQFAVLVADGAVLGICRALLRNEFIKPLVEVFDLWQLPGAVLAEVSLRRAVLLNLVGMGIEKFARIARRLVLVEGFSRLGVGHNLHAQLGDLLNLCVNCLDALVHRSELFTRGVGAGVEFLPVLDAVLLQVQQGFGHLLYVENLRPLCVATAFPARELGLDVYEQTRVLTLPARIVRRFALDDRAQFSLGVARAERVKPDALLPVLVECDALSLAHPVAAFADYLEQSFKILRFSHESIVDCSSQHIAVRRWLFVAQPLVVGWMRVTSRVLDNGQPMLYTDEVREPAHSASGAEEVTELRRAVEGGGVE